MQFLSPVQQQNYERISPMMKELFGEFVRADTEKPLWAISMGSAWVQVAVVPWGDDDAVVQAWAWVITGVDMTPDLMKFLLNQNYNMRFGAFGVDQENDIMLSHSIVASHCDKEELKATVLAVLYTADQLDDEIMSRFGGQRAIDRTK